MLEVELGDDAQMTIFAELTDGREFVIDATLDEWDSAFRSALRKGEMLEIVLPDGSVMPIDPRSVQSFREAPEGEAELEELHQQAAEAAEAAVA